MKLRKVADRTKLTGYLLVLPALILYLAVVIIPLIDNIMISFTNWNGYAEEYDFVGLKNYTTILSEAAIYKALWVTIKIAVLVVLLQQVCGLLLAVLLQRSTRTTGFFRSLFFIPNLLNTVVVVLIFSYALNVNFGFVNPSLAALGFDKADGIDFLGDPQFAVYTVIFITVWQFAGLSMMIYLSSLMNIPADLYESADIDGASPWKRFWNITFPLIAPAFTINSLITLIGTLKLFDIPYLLNGGAIESTRTIAIVLYNETFTARSAGKGAAYATILLVAVLALSLMQNTFLRKREVEM